MIHPPDRPGVCFVTCRTATSGRPLLEVVKASIAGGCDLVQVREKDLEGVIAPLRESPALRDAAVIATSVPDTPRSNEPLTVAQAWGHNAITITDTDEALAAAIESARQAGGPLVIAGSLYLVGHVRDKLMGKR